jgi:hypothetical protein
VPAASDDGSTAATGSEQFHVQFQTHVEGEVDGELGADPVGTAGVVGGITGVELVLPELPL